MSMSYAQMVAGCRRQKKAAWRALYDEFAPMVMGVCKRYSSCDDEANDLLQDTFVKVIEKIGTVRDPQKLRSWIYNIAVNTCIQDYRRRNRTTLSDAMDEMNSGETELKYGMEEMVEAMGVLTPAQRMAVNLHYVEELSPDEVAQRMGCTPSGFRSILCKGVARMRNYFDTKHKS